MTVWPQEEVQCFVTQTSRTGYTALTLCMLVCCDIWPKERHFLEVNAFPFHFLSGVLQHAPPISSHSFFPFPEGTGLQSCSSPAVASAQPLASLEGQKKGQEKSEKTFEKKVVQWVKQKLHRSREKIRNSFIASYHSFEIKIKQQQAEQHSERTNKIPWCGS